MVSPHSEMLSEMLDRILFAAQTLGQSPLPFNAAGTKRHLRRTGPHKRHLALIGENKPVPKNRARRDSGGGLPLAQATMRV